MCTKELQCWSGGEWQEKRSGSRPKQRYRRIHLVIHLIHLMQFQRPYLHQANDYSAACFALIILNNIEMATH